MSKLEKGDIKTIEESELTAIFKFIFGNNDADFQSFLNSSLGQILDTLALRYSDKEISEQLWLDNYDTVLRLIPVPGDLIDELHNRMVTINLSIDRLCERINANEGISPEVTNVDQYPFNKWQAFVVDHKIEFSFIKMRVNARYIEKLFSKEIISANYVTMLSIVYYLSKTESHGFQCDIPDDAERQLMKEAKEYLRHHRFYSLVDKARLRKEAQSKEEREALLSSFDKENGEIINEVLLAFRVFSELDIAKTNESLTAFINNLKWDSGYMLKLISIAFHEMGDVSFSLKKEMLTEIQNVIAKYKGIPDTQKRIETYD